MTDARVSPPVDAAGRGFKPASRRRNRIALGVLLAAIAIGGNVFVYSSLDSAEPVVQVVRDVPAGEQLTSDMLRTVEVDADSTVNLVAGDQLDSLVGSYAKVRLVSGSLVTAEALQSTPLVERREFRRGHPGRRGDAADRCARAGGDRAGDSRRGPGRRRSTPASSGCPWRRVRRSASNRCRWRSTRATLPRWPRPTTSASCWWNRPTIPPPNSTVGHDHHRRHR